MRETLILAAKWCVGLVALAVFHSLSTEDKIIMALGACVGLLFLVSVRVNEILEHLRNKK